MRANTWAGKVQGYLASRLPWMWAAAATGLALPSLGHLAWSDALIWLVDLGIHWQWQFALLGMSLAALYLVMTRTRLAGAMLLVTAVATALNFGPLSLGRLDHGGAGPGLLVASFNVHFDNPASPGLEAWVQAEQPDLLALFEVTSRHAPLLARLKALYPYEITQLQDDPFGVALFSRRPLSDATVTRHQGSTPYVAATFGTGREQTLVRAIHPMPPISSADRAMRDALIHAVSRTQGVPTIIAGDFNASPWTLAMRQLADQGVKRATTLMPTHTLYGGLPIDHILATEAHWHVADAGVAGAFGSDHRLVWAKLFRR